MKNSFLDGIKFSAGIILIFGLLGLVYASGWHTANEIFPGNFSTGQYFFLGYVGINTTTPSQALDVNGNMNISGDIYTYGADFAEMFNSEEDLQPGDVVCLVNEYNVIKCNKDSDSTVMGVISTDYTLAGNQENAFGGYPVGIVGIVPTNVIGPIEKGDLLTTSSKSGFAKKASIDDFGTIIGKAMDNCVDECKINVLVGLK